MRPCAASGMRCGAGFTRTVAPTCSAWATDDVEPPRSATSNAQEPWRCWPTVRDTPPLPSSPFAATIENDNYRANIASSALELDARFDYTKKGRQSQCTAKETEPREGCTEGRHRDRRWKRHRRSGRRTSRRRTGCARYWWPISTRKLPPRLRTASMNGTPDRLSRKVRISQVPSRFGASSSGQRPNWIRSTSTSPTPASGERRVSTPTTPTGIEPSTSTSAPTSAPPSSWCPRGSSAARITSSRRRLVCSGLTHPDRLRHLCSHQARGCRVRRMAVR